MSVVIPHRAIGVVASAVDKKRAIINQVGDLSGVDVMFNMVLVAQYVRSNMAGKLGLIHRTDESLAEDVWQGKVGLVLKLGPNAFVDDNEASFYDQRVEPGDWCVFKVGDAWQLTIGDWPCRLVRDSSIKLKVKDPSIIL